MDYSVSLKGMGYTEEWVRKVVDSSLTGYDKLLYKVDNGEVKRNRRLFGNQEWFKQKKKNASSAKKNFLP